MRVTNLHFRVLPVSPSSVGSLLDSLSQRDDRLWPIAAWPAMRFDRPLQVGAVGGHGPIRYTVESYVPGTSIAFRFTAPAGFNGTHALRVDATPEGCRLEHELVMTTSGMATLSWLCVFRPLHDALVEDAMHRAEVACGVSASPPRWSVWVRILRAALGSRRRGRVS